MATDSVKALVAAIKQSNVLERSQLDLLDGMHGKFTDPKALLRELLQREWLSPYQANQIFQSRGRDLVLGPYVLLARIGDGVLGQVYKARHRRMNRLVELKVVRPELLTRPEAVERFYQESQVLSQLADPHIVHAYDAGPIRQTHFLSLEYVEGIDLDQLVEQAGPLPVSVALDFVLQTTQGLQHLHEKKLAHLDLKPTNLVVTRAGPQGPQSSQPVSGPPAGSLSWRSLMRTATGGGVLVKIRNLGLSFLGAADRGLPDFMAPERAAGAGDIRSDLYSLGCIYYFLLSGKVPFPGGAAADKIRRHQSEEATPIQSIRPEVGTEAAVIVNRLLAKPPQNRYQTPAELLQVLGGPGR